MKKTKIEQHPFEFFLKINGKPICQRFFNIHNFNPEVIDSIELKELLDRIAGTSNGDWGTMGIIPNFLKEKSLEYLNHFEENPHLLEKNKDITDTDIWDGEDLYTFEILIDGEVVGVRSIVANIFPPKIRYKVNLKVETNIWGERVLDDKGKPKTLDLIPKIVKDIKRTFSQKSYTKDYEGYPLDYITKLDQEYNKKYLTLVD